MTVHGTDTIAVSPEPFDTVGVGADTPSGRWSPLLQLQLGVLHILTTQSTCPPLGGLNVTFIAHSGGFFGNFDALVGPDLVLVLRGLVMRAVWGLVPDSGPESGSESESCTTCIAFCLDLDLDLELDSKSDSESGSESDYI